MTRISLMKERRRICENLRRHGCELVGRVAANFRVFVVQCLDEQRKTCVGAGKWQGVVGNSCNYELSVQRWGVAVSCGQFREGHGAQLAQALDCASGGSSVRAVSGKDAKVRDCWGCVRTQQGDGVGGIGGAREFVGDRDVKERALYRLWKMFDDEARPVWRFVLNPFQKIGDCVGAYRLNGTLCFRAFGGVLRGCARLVLVEPVGEVAVLELWLPWFPKGDRGNDGCCEEEQTGSLDHRGHTESLDRGR